MCTIYGRALVVDAASRGGGKRRYGSVGRWAGGVHSAGHRASRADPLVPKYGTPGNYHRPYVKSFNIFSTHTLRRVIDFFFAL